MNINYGNVSFNEKEYRIIRLFETYDTQFEYSHDIELFSMLKEFASEVITILDSKHLTIDNIPYNEVSIAKYNEYINSGRFFLHPLLSVYHSAMYYAFS